MTAGDKVTAADVEWYRRRALLLNRAGRAITKDEHDRLTAGLNRPLTDDPITLRTGRDIIAADTPNTPTKGGRT